MTSGMNAPVLIPEAPRVAGLNRKHPDTDQVERPRRSRWVISAAVLLLLASVGVILLDQILRPSSFDLDFVSFTGDTEGFVEGDLLRIVRPEIVGNYFSVDLKRIESRLNAVPGIYNATVRRIWPNRLEIHVSQSRAFASWAPGDPDESEFLNLPPEIQLAHVPLLRGPNRWRESVFRALVDACALLHPVGLTPVAVERDPVGGWRMTVARPADLHAVADQPISALLDDPGFKGVNLTLGQFEVTAKLRHFVAAYLGDLQSRFEEVAAVDLRYPSGLAVQWVDGNGPRAENTDANPASMKES